MKSKPMNLALPKTEDEMEVERQEFGPNGMPSVPAVVEPSTGVNLFNAPNPVVVLERATAVAKVLAGVIEAQGLFTVISQRRHVRVEGWTLCGSMLGVFPVCVWTRPIEGGWEARVEAKTMDGSIVGAAEAQCTKKEKTWASRDDYAIRSMAQTRATSKAMRLPLGFIIQLAGYEACPAEEMPTTEHQDTSPKIGGGEVSYLKELIDEVRAEESKLLKYCGVTAFSDITVNKYNEVVAMLEKRKA